MTVAFNQKSYQKFFGQNLLKQVLSVLTFDNSIFLIRAPAVMRKEQYMDDTKLKKLGAELEKKTGRKITIQCREDPSLIGGLRVEIDGRVIDGSIRNKLEEIKEVMNS